MAGIIAMKKKIIIWCFCLFLLAAAGYTVYHRFFTKGPASVSSPQTLPKTETNLKSDVSLRNPVRQTDNRKPSKKASSPGKNVQESIGEEIVENPKDIKEIRKQIYDMEIEYVEDIPLLDEIVQTGNTDVRKLWEGDWHSADDFKAEEEGFKLEENQDGTYKFTPDEVTARSYSFFETPHSFSYDPDQNEFNWDVDYYGKTITNKFKFINDETAVLMIISGRKVTTNIYRKNQPPDPEYILPEEKESVPPEEEE